MESLRNKVYLLLRKSERVFKTDMVYLVKGGFWLTASQGIAMATGFILSLAMANLISPTSFGNYKFILAASGIIGAFSLTGMGTAVTQAVSRGYEGTYKQALATTFKWSLILTVISTGTAGYYFLQANYVLSFSFILLAVFSPIISSASLYSSYINGKRDFKTQANLNIGRNIFTSATLILTIFITENPIVIIASYLLSNVLAIGLCYLYTEKRYQPEGQADNESISYGKHLSLMGVILTIADNVDKILIFHYLGAVQLAVYSFALAPVNQLKAPEKILGELALPKLSGSNLSDLKKSLPAKVLILILMMLGIVIAYILAAPYIFQYLFPQYIESVRYSQVFSLTLILVPSLIFGQTLTAHMQTKALYITRTALPALKIILFMILLPLYGIWGAVITLLVIQIARFILQGYFFYRSA